MTVETNQIGELMRQLIPWVRTVGIEYLEAGPERVVVALPDDEQYRNHVGGPHAAMMFGAAETASGALFIAAFADQLALGVPLVSKAEITYFKLALGPLRATATFVDSVDDVVAQLTAGESPKVPITVEIANADGVPTGKLDIVWRLKPHAKH